MLYRVYAGYSEYFIDLTSKLMLHSHFWARNETMTKTFINLQIKKKKNCFVQILVLYKISRSKLLLYSTKISTAFIVPETNL